MIRALEPLPVWRCGERGFSLRIPFVGKRADVEASARKERSTLTEEKPFWHFLSVSILET